MIVLAVLAVDGQGTHFLPGNLAVLRAGDGMMDLNLRQAPIFVDQFDPKTPNAGPSMSVPIPTNGADCFFFNGHAATEGILTRSADRRFLAFAGYGGVNLLQQKGTPSLLDIKRGFCTVDAAGTIHPFFYQADTTSLKVNPRGVATDGKNNFWGCGNANGTFYCNPASAPEPVAFHAVPNSRAIKIVNNALYVAIDAADGTANGQEAGIYSFTPNALPRQADAAANLVIAAGRTFKKTVGFDINPGGTIAYMADVVWGVQKYVKSGGDWKLAYDFRIPQNIPKELNNFAGCFALTVDFSGTAPIIYATTTEGYGGSVNSNRVVRIVDTGANAPVTTIAQAGSTNIVFRGVEFTPESAASSPATAQK